MLYQSTLAVKVSGGELVGELTTLLGEAGSAKRTDSTLRDDAHYKRAARNAQVEIIFFSMPTPAAIARSYSSGTVAES